ncbi:sensor histidine kinase [Pseudomarimonas arenosa]|uniref:Sensor histidine kinase n=1 Tax=Pseudomarimonas arenosa TaxID=2774145 RepID=A0AAW3ZK52_9GAMM|nr:sensor histidine kinase [Pseudomarimonas arenosa]MBD8524676.1 sensor histidine kinase [Pseudomarimonas arenosa]
MPSQRFAPTQMLTYAGLFTWVCVGIPMMWQPWYFGESSGLSDFSQLAWRACYFTFGASYLFVSRRLGLRRARLYDLAALVLLTVSAIGVSRFSDSGLGSILLMVVSGVLPWYLRLSHGVAWLIAQHIAAFPIFLNFPEYELLDAFLQSTLYMGFASFVFVTSLVARQQAQAREEQRRLNSELRATRALLAESSRLTERMRISRELHDLLGHHLTALSLNLEVASHVSTGKAQEHVRKSQSLAKLLLTDVREAVSQLREDDSIDVREALASLVDDVPGIDIHLQVEPDLRIGNPARAQVVLRCAQEIITNTVRHAGASKLQLKVAAADGGVAIAASDNGRGADAFVAGNGLRGMRERLENVGGRLKIDTAPDKGFAVDAWVPLQSVQGD